jgi:hypothetical protein
MQYSIRALLKKIIPFVNILAEEIKSWKDFEYALREENAFLFNEMLSECGVLHIRIIMLRSIKHPLSFLVRDVVCTISYLFRGFRLINITVSKRQNAKCVNSNGWNLGIRKKDAFDKTALSVVKEI